MRSVFRGRPSAVAAPSTAAENAFVSAFPDIHGGPDNGTGRISQLAGGDTEAQRERGSSSAADSRGVWPGPELGPWPPGPPFLSCFLAPRLCSNAHLESSRSSVRDSHSAQAPRPIPSAPLNSSPCFHRDNEKESSRSLRPEPRQRRSWPWAIFVRGIPVGFGDSVQEAGHVLCRERPLQSPGHSTGTRRADPAREDIAWTSWPRGPDNAGAQCLPPTILVDGSAGKDGP